MFFHFQQLVDAQRSNGAVSIMNNSFSGWSERNEKRCPGHQLGHLTHEVIYRFKNLYIDLVQRLDVCRHNLLDDRPQTICIPVVRLECFSEDLMKHMTVNLGFLSRAR